ncbi:MAG: hypothetical protein KGL05_06245, partial [Acidobacteriota bacterium]|nr:hypothetical protein [Acidobacteriota bacterium]
NVMVSYPVPAAPCDPTLVPVNCEPRHVVSDAGEVVVEVGTVVVVVEEVVVVVAVVVVVVVVVVRWWTP